MRGRVRRISCDQRELLLAGWSVIQTPAAEANTASPPPADAAWLGAPTAGPLAAVLRARGEWSLDGPPHRFDGQDVWYRLQFDAPTGFLTQQATDKLILGFDGLATVSQVWLNGQSLLSSDSMFVAHECDVSGQLRTHGNELLLRFCALDTQLAMRRPRPRWRAPMIENQQLRWFRTTLLGRTPGWSPSAAVVGPWKDIWLEQRRAFSVQSLQLTTRLEGHVGMLDVALGLELIADAEVDEIVVELQRNGVRHQQPLLCRSADQRYVGTLNINDVDRWWPHTHGEPALYAASLTVQLRGAADQIHVDLGRLGFRTLTLDTQNGDFSLHVNGVPVFCRGACWTPLDVVTLRATPQANATAVAQACDAGMNMLRVTGTMVYEDDAFFDACDEQGMLVWQDFMFANMDYPDNDESFVALVEKEVRQQLSRWQARPSLTVLCGNSEVEQQAAMWGATRDLWAPRLFHVHLAQWAREEAPDVPYWPSSAHGGTFPFQGDAGTTSYYGVGAYLRPLEDARRADVRFATECLAFANVPSFSSTGRLPGGHATRVHHPGWKARSPRDLGAGWDFDDVRDHYLSRLFDVDPQKLRYSDHDRYLTLSRVTTGEVMAATFGEWRRASSRCRGALVLFLRDLWPAAGWGLIDDKGSPKACFHYLKRVLQPVCVVLTDEGGNGLMAHLINERNHRQLVELEISVWRDGEVLVSNKREALELPAHAVQALNIMALFEHFSDLTYAYRFGPLPHGAIVATLRDQDGKQLSQAFHFPSGLNANREADIGLSATVRPLADGKAELTVRTRRLAHAVHFDIAGFEAEDEYFHLAPGSERRVILRSLENRPPQGTVHAINTTALTRVEISAP